MGNTTEIQSIGQVESPVRGREYLVQVAVLKPALDRARSHYFNSMQIVPVLGPAHADPELGVSEPHYHVDWRFMPSDLRRAIRNEYAAGQEKGIVVWAGDVVRMEEAPMTYRLPASQWPAHSGGLRIRQTLENTFSSARLKSGKICPHRGADLSHCKPDENGIIECPMHGLRWHASTGELYTAPTPA